MKRKHLITILAAIVLTATLSFSLFFAPFQATAATATAYNTDGMTVNGVLATDNYVLFPFEKKNLIFGFSKYGELINAEVEPAQGLEYDGMDVFANPNVLEKDWSQGWLIDIHYADLENEYKRAWAYALYSDLSGTGGIGGPWQQGCADGPLAAPHGGRKTNVWATTDPITVLYDGPRRFVALTKTTLYDAETKTSDDALVSITITFVFNKDKKQVTLFKDIKRLALGKFGRTFQVEFSNRGEWDIGTSASPPAYAHFYDDQATVYNYEYHDFYDSTNDITGYDVCQMIDEDGSYVGFAAYWPQLFGKLVDGTTHITRSTILNSLCTQFHNETWDTLTTSGADLVFTGNDWLASDPYPTGLGAVSDEPMVFKNGILLTGGVGNDYTWVGDETDTITFTPEPATTDYITVVYKHLTNDGALDMTSEPDTPYVIGEWCFDLENEDHKRQFRAVTMYGLTDWHDADDAQWGAGDDIDSEVQYLLDETFNPYDLYSAVEKDKSRKVKFFEGDDETKRFHLPDILGLLAKGDGASAELSPDKVRCCKQYSVKFTMPAASTNWDTTAELRLFYGQPLDTISYGDISFTYYTDNTPNPWPSLILDTDGDNVADYAMIGAIVTTQVAGEWTTTFGPLYDDWKGATYDPTTDIFTFDGKKGTTAWFQSEFPDATLLYVYLGYGGPAHDGMVLYVDSIGIKDVTYSLEDCKLVEGVWDEYCSFAERILVDGVLQERDVDYSINFNTEPGLITFLSSAKHIAAGWSPTDTPPLDAVIKVLYSTYGGSYEWIVVGKDAATIDSIGAAYMTEAFDSIKHIDVQVTGLDINDTVSGPRAPFVMGNAATGIKADYQDELGRTYLRDDWCHTYPVSSSNMLFSGGPLANLGAEYFNEFTNAFWARSEYVVNDTGQADKIFALSCWNKYSYGSGYAVVSVYKDLNGTIGFLIWGTTGQDTYYAAKWFWETGIEYLQTENRGVTDIILEIDYTTCPPTVDLAIPPDSTGYERLGTISEKACHDP